MIALMLVLGITAIGQNRQTGKIHDYSNKEGYPILHNILGSEAIDDTLQPSLLSGCDPGPVMVADQDGGWVSGTNSYGDLEKAQRIETTTSGKVYSALIAFGAKSQVGPADNFTAKLYTASGTGAPGASMGSSLPVGFIDIDTSGLFTRFEFSPPVAYAGDFFVALPVDNTGGASQDTVGILHTSTSTPCGGGSAYEMWNDFMWYAFNASNSWNIDLVMYMFAEVETDVVGVNDHLIKRGSHKMVPSPAASHSMLVYSLLQPGDVVITITDMSGRTILTRSEGQLDSGLHNANINVSNLATGMYLYTVTTNGQPTSGTFVVAR